jgi:hypothetical protein
MNPDMALSPPETRVRPVFVLRNQTCIFQCIVIDDGQRLGFRQRIGLVSAMLVDALALLEDSTGTRIVPD